VYGETQKSQRNQCSRCIPVAPATPRYFCKVRRLPSPKAIQNQALTRAVLNSRSREVWRQTGREREFRAPTESAQCGGFAANGRRCWRFERAENRAEKVGLGWSGGEGGIRTPDTVTRMPHFECGAFNRSATSPQPEKGLKRPKLDGGYLTKRAGTDKGAR
jgi:hypothetical protein